MSILIILTCLFLLTGLFFLHIGSLREERGFYLRMMMAAGLFVWINQYLMLAFTGPDQQFFESAVGLSMASLSSLYFRNIMLEQRTSFYLLLLAFFPLILFYVYYVLFLSFSERLLYGEVYHFLDLFYQNFQTILLLGSLLYDLFILKTSRLNWRDAVQSVDAKLAFMLVLVKCLMLFAAFGIALFSHVGAMLKFPVGIYIALLWLLICYYRFGIKIRMIWMHVNHAQYINRYLADRKELEMQEKERFQLSMLHRILDRNPEFLRADFALEQLLDESDLSKKEILQLIRKQYQCGFNAFIKQKRIQYCIKNLDSYLDEGKSIVTLAQHLGFKSLNSFVLAFKKEVGCSPYLYFREKKQNSLSLKGH